MVVKNVRQVIEQVIKTELDSIDSFKYKVSHRPTIGSQYEGVLINALNKAFPDHLNLKVVSGFIGNDLGNLSEEIDCMLVNGEGEFVPSIGKLVYPVSKVLVIFEVKKRMFTKELNDAFFHLKGIQEFDRHISGLNAYEWREFRKIFLLSTGVEIKDYQEVSSLEPQIEMIFHELLMQYLNPLRVIFAFSGLKSETSLRKSFYSILEDNISVRGFGPFSIPDLIICEDACIVKFNGQPYCPQIECGQFSYIGSSQGYNLDILTEMIAYKISKILFVDYDEFDIEEKIKRFISATFVSVEDRSGWAYWLH